MGKTFRIAVVLETFAEHGRSVVRGVANYVDRGAAWELHTVALGKNHASILKAAMRADGVITRPHHPDMQRILQQAKKPTVAVGSRGRLRIPSVSANPVANAKLAADYFTGQGLRHFGYFGPSHKQFSKERCRAFAQLVAGHGVFHSCSAGCTEPEKLDWYAPDKQVVDWLCKLPKPIGILAANDFLAQQLLLSAPYAGVRVPDDVAVVGIGNDELICRLTSPQLSSIDHPGEQIGYIAASLLDQLLHGVKLGAKKVLVDPAQLVVRQSSDVLAVTDPSVAQAMRLIRERSGRLCVEDILAEVPVVRRTLERSFRKLLERTIHDEIMETRVREVKKLLLETDRSISEITELAGFCNRSHLAEAFKERTGHAPAKFRREFQLRG